MLLVHVTGKILTLATHIQPCLTSAASFSVSVCDLREKLLCFLLMYSSFLDTSWFQAKFS